MNNRHMILVSVLGSSLLTAVTAQGATICKGKPEADCTKTQVFKDVPACIWIKERNTASGSTVKAHCRGSNKSVPADAVKVTETKPTN